MAKIVDGGNSGPIPHQMHQKQPDTELVGQADQPQSNYYLSQYNNCDPNFPHTLMGLEPGNFEPVPVVGNSWN